MKNIFTLFLFLIAGAAARAQSQPLASIPFWIEKNGIYFYGKVNQTDSLKFLFDTGANVMVLTEKAASVLGLTIDGESLNTGSNGTNTVKNSINNLLAFGGLSHPGTGFTIIPYSDVAFDGIFGSNLMKNYAIKIDYHEKRLNFYRPGSLQKQQLEGYEKLSITDVDGYPAVQSTLTILDKKYTGLFGLDTGADDALTVASPFAKKHALAGKMEQIGSAGFLGSDGVAYTLPIVIAPEINMGKKSFYRIPVSLALGETGNNATTKMAGYFGNNFLKRFNAVIDLGNNALYLKPNDLLHSSYFD